MATPFDAGAAQPSGDAFSVADGVFISLANAGYAPVTISESGVLLYWAGNAAAQTNQMVWYDRSGKALGSLTAPAAVFMPAISPDEKEVAFLRAGGGGTQGQLSPDGRWMAYTSDESVLREVYVRPFPSGDGKWKISTAGGEQPRWRGDGKELFYAAADGKMNAVAVKTTSAPKPSFEPSVPIPLFDSHIVPFGSLTTVSFQYDVTANGKRFLVTTSDARAASSPTLTVVVNWIAGLKK